MRIKLKRPNHKYTSCHLVARHLRFPVTTTRYIPRVEFVFPSLRFGRLYQIWRPTVRHDRLETTKLLNRRRKLISRARCKREQQPTASSSDVERRLHAAFNTAAEPKERAVGRGHLSLLSRPSSAVPSPPTTRRYSPTTTTVATFSSHNCAPQVSERQIVELACVCEVTSGREMAGRNLRNRSIVFVEDSIVRRDSNGGQ